MKIIIKNFKTNSLISGIAFTLLGLLLAIFPTAASQFVGYILGAVLVVLGVISLVRYFSTLSMFVWYQGDFLLGLFETLFGLFIFLNPGIVMASIPFFLTAETRLAMASFLNLSLAFIAAIIASCNSFNFMFSPFREIVPFQIVCLYLIPA